MSDPFEASELFKPSAGTVPPSGGAMDPMMAGTSLDTGAPRDRTASTKVEQQLRKERDVFLAILQNSPAFFVTTDMHGAILMMNTAMLTALGYTEAEISGKPFLDLFIPEQDKLSLVSSSARMIATGETMVHENIVLARDGRALLVQWHGRLLMSGQTVGLIFGIGIDITERRREEVALKECAERFCAFFHASFEAIILSENGICVDINESTQAIFGYSRPELIGQSVLVFCAPESYLEILRHIEQGSEEPYEAIGVRKDGRRFPIELQGRMFSYRGRTMRASAVRDITERKLAEKQRQICEARLAQAQKLQAIGTLAGGIAHDFNNILSAIIGYTEVAQLYIPLDSKACPALEEVLMASERARDLIKQILTFSRQTEIERRPVQVSLIAKEALKLLRSSIPSTISMHEEIDPAAGMVLADPSQIHQVIMNLCTNAYQAMLEGGGRLTLTLAAVDLGPDDIVHHPQLTPGRHLKLSVSDTGHGMDAETMQRIFDPFFTTKIKGQATGLGLATVHGIVTNLGGTVTVKSSIDGGSTFDVHLPTFTGEVRERNAVAASIPRGRGETIMVVDDEASILNIATTILEKLGYRVRCFASGPQALDVFKADPQQYDLVVTDQTMPGLTGIQLAAEFLSLRPQLPIILSSGYSELITPEQALASGIRQYLEKPFSWTSLALAVAAALHGPEDGAPGDGGADNGVA